MLPPDGVAQHERFNVDSSAEKGRGEGLYWAGGVPSVPLQVGAHAIRRREEPGEATGCNPLRSAANRLCGPRRSGAPQSNAAAVIFIVLCVSLLIPHPFAIDDEPIQY